MIKNKLKGIHSKEFKGIKDKIDLSRQQLDLIQTQLQLHPTYSSLLVQEQECSVSQEVVESGRNDFETKIKTAKVEEW